MGAPEAAADPRAGGELPWMHPDGSTVGRFVELVPHRRVVFTYGWEVASWSAAAGNRRLYSRPGRR